MKIETFNAASDIQRFIQDTEREIDVYKDLQEKRGKVDLKFCEPDGYSVINSGKPLKNFGTTIQQDAKFPGSYIDVYTLGFQEDKVFVEGVIPSRLQMLLKRLDTLNTKFKNLQDDQTGA